MNTSEDIEKGHAQPQDEDSSLIYPKHASENLAAAFGKENLRHGFIKKVYGILTVQLLFTILTCYVSMNSKTIQNIMNSEYGGYILGLSLAINIITLLILGCFRDVAKEVPKNYILLFAFTLSESISVSFICIGLDPEIIMFALVSTFLITVCLTLIAVFYKTDFTAYGFLLFLFGFALLFFSNFFLFFSNLFGGGQLMVCFLGVLLYGFYIIYDTQLIIGGGRYELEYDDYILGALLLYVDIIVMFLKILEIYSKAKREN